MYECIAKLKSADSKEVPLLQYGPSPASGKPGPSATLGPAPHRARAKSYSMHLIMHLNLRNQAKTTGKNLCHKIKRIRSKPLRADLRASKDKIRRALDTPQ